MAVALTLLDRLRAAVGDEHVLIDPELRRGFECDITGRYSGLASAVVRPADTAQVVAVLRACHEEGAAVVPQGGNTGLVGGGVPREGEVVLSLRRLTEREPVDRAAGQVVVGAGTTLEELQAHARAAGMEAGIDLPARGTATIGGMIATNAGGALAVRYGTMRARVAGVEAVLADGTVVRRLSGLFKDNAGYDLSAMLVGSEGTLAVVTRACMRLEPARGNRVVALVGLVDLDEALALTTRLRAHVPSLMAVDFFMEPGLEIVRAHRGLGRPLPAAHGAYLVVECGGETDPTEELAAAVGDADVAVADDSGGRAALWAYRELHNEALNALGIPHKLDVSVPVSAVPAFVRDVGATLAAIDPAARLIVYGHLGDGNVHVNVLGPAPNDHTVDEAVLELAPRHGGSISAEHGIGVAKTRYLRLSRSEEEIAVMRSVKAAFDPAGILNPGCVLG